MSILDQGDFERVMQRGMSGGWDALEGFSADLAKKLQQQQKQQQKTAEDLKTISAALREFANTPGGAKAIQFLCDQTINRQVFQTHLPLTLDQIAIQGAHREGANQLMYSILKLIAEGEPEERQPKPREAKP